MKKTIFLTAFCTILSITAFAQASFGIKAGGMLSNIVNQDLDTLDFTNSDAKVSYLLGAFVTLPLSDKLSLQPELLYANKGRGRFEGSERPSGLHYLCLPVLLQYEVLSGLRIGVGPEISYLLNPGDSRFVKDWDFALNASASYALTEQWLVDLRYNLGIYNISEPLPIGVPNSVLTNVIARNRSVQLTLGYRFR